MTRPILRLPFIGELAYFVAFFILVTLWLTMFSGEGWAGLVHRLPISMRNAAIATAAWFIVRRFRKNT